MTQKRNSRSVQATPDGVRLLQQAKAMGRVDEGKPLTYPLIAESARVSDKTVERFFRKQNVDRDSALSIIEALGLQAKDVLSMEESLVAESIDKIKSGSKASSDRATQLIEGLEVALGELTQDDEVNLQAMEWLKAHRKGLARDAAHAVLRKPNIDSSETASSDESDLEQFAQDLRKYLQLLYYCLELGTWELIDKTVQESLVPVNREIELYTEALIFIKEQRIEQQLSSDVSQLIAPYLDYLISILPIRF